MDAAQWALRIAGLSLLVSVLSLTWQIITWVRQSARIKVELRWGGVSEDWQYTVTGDPKNVVKALAQVDPTEYPIPVAALVIRNVGRSAMSIQDAGIQFPEGFTYRHRDINQYADVSKPLPPGDVLHVPVPIAHLFQVWADHGGNLHTTRIRGIAFLGNGKTSVSERFTLSRSDQPFIEERFD
ncbi:hypothetical protein [Phytoactinopolyspora endophytica]|uniref:hypothetical protein n=1 Tax=Phytoactinopolyspora endophytica TaxID=1642495 RepID=UPI00101D37CD|nr:hypothetical protein [Phytoactinopolyspora endophytica]